MGGFDMSLIAPIIDGFESTNKVRQNLLQPDGLMMMFMDMFQNPNKYNIADDVLSYKSAAMSDERVQYTPQEWAEKFRLIKGKPVQLYNYQIPIINDMSPRQVIEKAAQLGLSEIVLTKLFWWCDYHAGRANIIYTFPTFNDMLTYAAARVQPIVDDAVIITPDDFGYYPGAELEEITYISTLMRSNSVKLKRIRDTFLFLKGTMGDRNAISVDSDWNIHDEVNFSDQSVLNKFRSRLGASSSMGWEYNFSTPTIPGYGVSALMKQSDFKRWYVKCPHCNKRQHMEYETHVSERPKRSQLEPTSYYYRCEKCGEELTQRTISNGEYVAEYPENSEVSGYHINKMISYSADALMKSKEQYRRLADFYNSDLGKPYAEKSISLTEEIVRANYFPEFQFWSSAKPEDEISMGVDQGDTLWAILSRINPITEKRQIVYMEEIDERDCANNDPFSRAEELFLRFNVKCAVFDMNPNKNDVRKLRNKYPGKIFMATYAGIKGEIVSFNENDMIVNIDRTEYFKEVFNHIYTGGLEVPDGTVIGELFIEHLCNMQKESVTNDDTSDVKEYFVRIGPDHLAHANLYDEVAREFMRSNSKTNSEAKVSQGNAHWQKRSSPISNVGNNMRPGLGGQGVIPRGSKNPISGQIKNGRR